jgi:hypothetical protein
LNASRKRKLKLVRHSKPPVQEQLVPKKVLQLQHSLLQLQKLIPRPPQLIQILVLEDVR